MGNAVLTEQFSQVFSPATELQGGDIPSRPPEGEPEGLAYLNRELGPGNLGPHLSRQSGPVGAGQGRGMEPCLYYCPCRRWHKPICSYWVRDEVIVYFSFVVFYFLFVSFLSSIF